MLIKNNAAIVGEFRNYRNMILASPEHVTEQEGDSVRLTSRLDLDCRSDGTWSSRKSLTAGATVGGTSERIVERYSFTSIFGVEELAWRVDTEYAGYTTEGRSIIEKKSIDLVHDTPLSTERVDASTGEVLDEWFIADYKQRVLEPRHACDPDPGGKA